MTKKKAETLEQWRDRILRKMMKFLRTAHYTAAGDTLAWEISQLQGALRREKHDAKKVLASTPTRSATGLSDSPAAVRRRVKRDLDNEQRSKRSHKPGALRRRENR